MKNRSIFFFLFVLFSIHSVWGMMPLDTTAAFTIAPGCDYMAVRWLRNNNDPNSGINSFILRVDAKNPNVSFQQRLGKETLMGREKLTKIVARINQPVGTNPICIAAVNGDFFWMENEARENGLLRGFTVQDNEFVITTDEDRRLGGITEDKLGLVGGHGVWTGTATIGGETLPLARINYCRKENELVLFNQYNDHTTGTDSLGTEVLLELLPGEEWHCNCRVKAVVKKIEQQKGSMVIPKKQIVLSGSGNMAKALDKVQTGDIVTIETTFSLDGEPTNYNQCIGSDQYAQILKNGVVETQNFWPGDHPRNSFGYTQSRDTFFFVLVDGRTKESPGCTTSELGEMMKQIGCYNATNWDGGRSAHLWLRGYGFMNKGCDTGKRERAISNAMLIYYKMEHQYNKELDSLLHANPTRVGGNYTGYDFSPREASAAPKGYEAFYLSHYGRHGSRSRHNSKPYEQLRTWLTDAQGKGNLTEKGEELLAMTNQLLSAYNHMPSRLTDKGEQEHTQLAERMYKRYPEIFKGQGQIRAIASQKPRCLISMNAFTNQLARMNKDLCFDLDCGQEIQKIISPASDDENKRCQYVQDSLVALLADDSVEVYKNLFVHPEQMAAAINAKALQDAVYETIGSAQCFDLYANMYDYLPSSSVYRREMDMAWGLWMRYGNNDLQDQTRGAGVRISLDDIIKKADDAIHGLPPATCNLQPVVADLRFGHDTQMLCILGAMGVSGIGEKMQPEELEWKWYTYRDLPMASNVQLVFYRPKKKAAMKCSDDEILVKVLYNETERQLIGLTPAQGNYYRWSDVKLRWQVVGNR